MTSGKAGPNIDQMVLWPQAGPSTSSSATSRGPPRPRVQRIDLRTGDVVDVVARGMTSCDPVRVTPWGTVLFGEEAGDRARCTR